MDTNSDNIICEIARKAGWFPVSPIEKPTTIIGFQKHTKNYDGSPCFSAITLDDFKKIVKATIES